MKFTIDGWRFRLSLRFRRNGAQHFEMMEEVGEGRCSSPTSSYIHQEDHHSASSRSECSGISDILSSQIVLFCF
ncbi:MAG: hypothetical protein J5644_02645 [Bacteroidales bacterium]|nr:hypothetical protein [Bacteroidales bacterium]